MEEINSLNPTSVAFYKLFYHRDVDLGSNTLLNLFDVRQGEFGELIRSEIFGVGLKHLKHLKSRINYTIKLEI